EGVDLAAVPPIPLHDGGAADPVAAVVERAFLTGMAHIAEGPVASVPAACIPLPVEDRAVGAIVVFDLLAQKAEFVTVDRELFKLLGAHAGAALVAAYLYTSGDGRVPSPDALRSLVG
ncbi:MAG TPA: hypothetical protein VHS09_13740, partial [Polyangiaceae bacterium]|nr:hypothetical protein [Polyangiaceae bacterium]